MKTMVLFLLFLVTCSSATLRAEADAAKEVEWVMTLGCRHCHFGEQTGITVCKGNCGAAASKAGSVFQLSGTAVPKDFKKGGNWLVKGTLSADGKTIAVKEMAPQPPTPDELKEEKPASSSPEAKTYAGGVKRTGAGLPTLTPADGTRYSLKPSKAASTSTRYTLTRIGGGELTGVFSVTGATYEDDTHKWIVVDSIQALPEAPNPK